MTKKRYDNHSTEFGLWLREQPEIDSKNGYLATNIDFMWSNYNTGEWMLIEEKRYMAEPREWQRKLFTILNFVCELDPKYKGFHYIKFERTSPEDGKMYLDKKEVSRDELIEFLRFK